MSHLSHIRKGKERNRTTGTKQIKKMMYLDIVNKIKTHFDSDPIVTTCTTGDITKVDLAKQTLFPLAHIIVNSANLEESIIRYSVSIICMDVVDFSKSETVDNFEGNDNELYVLNTQMQVITRLYEILRRGDLHTEGFQVDGTPSAEPFTDRFENVVAGFTLSLDIIVPNDMTTC